MTDEEMAEQYAQNLEKELMKEYEEHSEYGQTPYLATIPTPHAKQAFLAGLKAGRPQWHDLKKDPNDLPKSPKLSVIGILKDGKFATGHSLIECYYSKECGWSDCYGNSLYREVEYWAEGNFPKK